MTAIRWIWNRLGDLGTAVWLFTIVPGSGVLLAYAKGMFSDLPFWQAALLAFNVTVFSAFLGCFCLLKFTHPYISIAEAAKAIGARIGTSPVKRRQAAVRVRTELMRMVEEGRLPHVDDTPPWSRKRYGIEGRPADEIHITRKALRGVAEKMGWPRLRRRRPRWLRRKPKPPPASAYQVDGAATGWQPIAAPAPSSEPPAARTD